MLADLLTRAVPPWARWLALAAVAAALYGTGRIHQARVDHAESVQQDRDRLAAIAAQLKRRAGIAHAVAAAYERDRERIRTVYRTIEREVAHVVERPVYRDCRLDPDGLRLVGAALAGVEPAAGGQFADSVQRPTAAR